jgi:hypothetical protein
MEAAVSSGSATAKLRVAACAYRHKRSIQFNNPLPFADTNQIRPASVNPIIGFNTWRMSAVVEFVLALDLMCRIVVRTNQMRPSSWPAAAGNRCLEDVFYCPPITDRPTYGKAVDVFDLAAACRICSSKVCEASRGPRTRLLTTPANPV